MIYNFKNDTLFFNRYLSILLNFKFNILNFSVYLKTDFTIYGANVKQ